MSPNEHEVATLRCRRSELLGGDPLSDPALERARRVVADASGRFILAVESTTSAVVLDGWSHDDGSGVVQARVDDDAAVPVGVAGNGDLVELLSTVWIAAVGEMAMWSSAAPIEVAGSEGLASGLVGCRQLVLLTSESADGSTRRLVVAFTDEGCLAAMPSDTDAVFVLAAASAVQIWSLVVGVVLRDSVADGE
jgi:hypothetical protein